jgi:hypothetical protein
LITRLDISKFVSFGLSEGKSLHEKPHNVEALKDNTQLEIANNENDVLWRTASNMERRVQVRLEEGGSPFII